MSAEANPSPAKPEKTQYSGEKRKPSSIYDELSEIVLAQKAEQESVSTNEDNNTSEFNPEEVQAWQDYAGYGAEYRRRNNERIRVGRIKVDKFGEGALTIIASINRPDAVGRVLSGHDYDPSAESHRDIESEYDQWLAETDPSQRLVIFEGDRRPQAESRDAAIIEGTESGLLQFLADAEGIESISGEPSIEEQSRYLAERGIGNEEATLYFLIRNLTHSKLGMEASEVQVPEDITLQIYGQAAQLGLEGFKTFSEEEKKEIQDDPEKMEQLRSQGKDLAESLNSALESLGLPTFYIGTADDPNRVTFRSAEDIVDLAKSWDPSNQAGRLAEIQRIITECRDKHLFLAITKAIREGKKPFVAYGGSHVMSLEPVFESYFRK